MGYIHGWLPGSSTRRTKSASETIYCYYRYNGKKKVLQKGQKPAYFPANKAITKKIWQCSLQQKPEPPNPVRTGFKFIEYLNDNPNATYDDLAAVAGITKARVCQLIARCKRLPPKITDFLMNTGEPEIFKYFTERRLRPLTLLASDVDKIKKFEMIKQTFAKALDF